MGNALQPRLTGSNELTAVTAIAMPASTTPPATSE
jgi:hypothetical protein